MNPPAEPARLPFLPNLSRPALLGVLCGVISAFGYTAANLCLRAVSHHDPLWVTAVKALPTVLLAGPWMLADGMLGRRMLPPPRVWGAIFIAALIGQVLGNVAFQWSLGVVGMALTVPLVLGTMIVGGALLGWLVLGEPVSRRAAVSIALLVAAIVILSLGTRQAAKSPILADSSLLLFLGALAAALSGIAYAFLGVVIRFGVTGQASLPATLFTVGLVGWIILGSASLYRLGLPALLDVNPHDLQVMLPAGLRNFIAFVALTKALQLTTVSHVNLMNASQTAMAACLGVWLFGEPASWPLVLGVLLTIVGLVAMRRPRPKVEVVGSHVAD